ncbi:MAG: anthranilate synthase component I [Acidobacteriota bacterium]
MPSETYKTPSGIVVSRSVSKIPYQKGLSALLRKLDTQRGIYLSSGYEYPERYSRWDVAATAPPIEIIAAGRDVTIYALNARGEVINKILEHLLRSKPYWEHLTLDGSTIRGRLQPLPALFSEEERSKQPSAFSMLRTLIEEFSGPLAGRLALVGAFGYDLLLQFDPINLKHERTGVKDLHLFLCDEIFFMDRKKEQIERYRFDFEYGELSTAGQPRTAAKIKFKNKPRSASAAIVSDHTQDQYMAKVEKVREGMKRGDYYEVVLRQTFRTPFSGSPSELFKKIQTASPSPYEFFLQLGDEQLIGASPEMYVRVEKSRSGLDLLGADVASSSETAPDSWRIETCPIAGTARRTGDPLKDADNIRALLDSPKEESELTMCSDVDRNDKSRVCVPGSVKVIARRLIERYAGLFHTVDHVEGILAPGFDSLDAFLSHMWAVTIIGAPKKWAAQAVEDLEVSARGWYGGAVGMITLNGEINTGITIRTTLLRDGEAAYAAGATLLYDSDPASEHDECRLKATGFFRALDAGMAAAPAYIPKKEESSKVRMLLVDNEDCFIHTLANYARQTGAQVSTYRTGFPLSVIEKIAPSMILVSPGPGRPSDFGVPDLIRHAAKLGIPVFGVCLGLQGMVEAFGGELGILDYPMHGKPCMVKHRGVGVFEGLPEAFQVGRYHSLYAVREKLPSCLEITAESIPAQGSDEPPIIMGVRHRDLPMEAVQFHPESILTLNDDCGLRLMENVVRVLGHAPVLAKA